MKTFKETASFELQFWLQVLGDHGRFIRDSLSHTETKHIETAKAFIQLFDQLLTDSRKAHSEDVLHELTVRVEKGGQGA